MKIITVKDYHIFIQQIRAAICTWLRGMLNQQVLEIVAKTL